MRQVAVGDKLRMEDGRVWVVAGVTRRAVEDRKFFSAYAAGEWVVGVQPLREYTGDAVVRALSMKKASLLVGRYERERPCLKEVRKIMRGDTIYKMRKLKYI